MNPLYIVIGAALLLGGKWEIPAIFQKKPPTAQLQAAQAELAAARAAQKKAEAELAAARAAQQAKTDEQLDYTQQMVEGTAIALQHVPADHQTPEVKLAAEFSTRAVAGFEAARGRLTPQQRAEIQALFDGAIAAKNAEVATLRSALEQKDKDLQATIQDKAALEKKIPILQSEVTTAKAETTMVTAKVEVKTAEVVTYANKVAEEKARAGGLDAYAGNLLHILIGLGLLYGLIHFGLPSLAQEFPGSNWLQVLNKTAKSVSSSHL